MATYTADVITLRSTRIRDAEAICHFLSRERGKIEAAARGIGRPGSKLTPATELFTLSRCLFAEGRNLHRLVQVEVQEAFYPLRLDMVRMSCAAFVVELVDKTTEAGEAIPEVFELVGPTLGCLCETDDPLMVTWGFEAQYLALAGLGAEMRACVSCGEADRASLAAYSPGVGGILCRDCAGHDEHRVVLPDTRQAFETLRRLGPSGACRVRVEPRVRRELDWIMTEHRRFHVEPEIRSARFLARLVARLPSARTEAESDG